MLAFFQDKLMLILRIKIYVRKYNFLVLFKKKLLEYVRDYSLAWPVNFMIFI